MATHTFAAVTGEKRGMLLGLKEGGGEGRGEGEEEAEPCV